MSNPGKFAGRGNPHWNNDNESEFTVPGKGVPSQLGGIPPGHYRKNDNESEFTVPGKGVPYLLGGIPPGHYRAGDISEGGVPGLLGGVPPGALLGAVWKKPIEITVEDEMFLTAQVFFGLVEKGADFKGSGSVILEDQVYDTHVVFNPDVYAGWGEDLDLVIRGDSDVSAGNWRVLTGDEKTTHENVQKDGGAVTMSSNGEITLHGEYNENNNNETNDNENNNNETNDNENNNNETNDNENNNNEVNDNENNNNEVNGGIDNTWASAFFDTTDGVVGEFNYFFNFEDGTFNSENNNNDNNDGINDGNNDGNNNNEANDENNSDNNNNENNNNDNNDGINDGNNDNEANDETSFSDIFDNSAFSMTNDAKDYFEAILLNNGYYIMTNSTDKDTFGVDGAEYVLVQHGTDNTWGISWDEVLGEMGESDWEEIDVIGVGYTGFWEIEANGA